MGENEITSTALSSLGADLSVSISFSVANEFIAAAREAQMGNDELVAMLVAVVVVVTSAKRFVDSVAKRLASGAKKRVADVQWNARRAPQGVARVCVPHAEYHPANHLVDFSPSFGLFCQGQSALEGRSGDHPPRGCRILRLL